MSEFTFEMMLLTFSCSPQGQIRVPREDSAPDQLLSKMVDSAGRFALHSPSTVQ